MLQNSRVTAFTVFELLRENQLKGGGVKLTHPPTKIRVKEAVNLGNRKNTYFYVDLRSYCKSYKANCHTVKTENGY